ncbi:MAG: ParA family partition ATPase [Magnetospirillum sp.]
MSAKAITVAQQKGGAGKSTITAQLAVTYAQAGKRVGIVDIDPQGSLAMWFEVRKMLVDDQGAGITFLQASGWRLSTELDRMKRDLDVILVDSPPHAETDVRIAVRAADLILVPMQPTPLDLWATQPTLDLAKKEKSQAIVVFNRTPPKGKLVDAVKAKILQAELPVAETVLGNRVAFAASMMEGKGVVETNPRHTATKEINALAAEIGAKLGL